MKKFTAQAQKVIDDNGETFIGLGIEDEALNYWGPVDGQIVEVLVDGDKMTLTKTKYITDAT